MQLHTGAYRSSAQLSFSLTTLACQQSLQRTQLLTMAQLCSACASLDLTRKDFTTSPLGPEERYNALAHSGTFGGLRWTYTTCSLCKLIWVALDKSDSTALANADDEHIWTLRWAQNTNDYQPDGETEDAETLFEAALYPCFGEEGGREDYAIQLIDDKNSSGFLRGRLVDDAIDVKLVASWIDRCKAQHGEQCARRSVDIRQFLPATLEHLLVIDVEALCLRKLPRDAQYAALSYVWGRSADVVTSRKTNIANFCEQNGLAVELPRTIQDAIDVTKALGLKYLWVDSLCIQQDDLYTKEILIANMDTIYGNANITLVAATGNNANSGLSGWSSKVGRMQHCVDLGEDIRLGVLPYYQRELLHCDHVTRAWT